MRPHAVLTRAAAAVAATALLCTPVAAQTPEHDAVRGTIQRLFDAMRMGDSATVRSVFHPQAHLQTIATRRGQLGLHTDSLDTFVREVGAPHPEPWIERVSNLEVRVDGEMAAVWMDYEFYLGDRYSHCGVNAAHLFRTPAGWKIIQITDTRRRQCTRANAPGAK